MESSSLPTISYWVQPIITELVSHVRDNYMGPLSEITSEGGISKHMKIYQEMVVYAKGYREELEREMSLLKETEEKYNVRVGETRAKFQGS